MGSNPTLSASLDSILLILLYNLEQQDDYPSPYQ